MSRIIDRCEALAQISDSSAGISRLYLSPAYREGLRLVEQWMQEAGMSTWVDAAGNQWGRLTARAHDAPVLILGSHLDTIPNAGKFDGILGVVSAIEAAARLHAAGKVLPFHLDVVGFGDEESVRFPSSMLGARAVCGQWQPEWLALADADGVTVREALLSCGLDPSKIGDASRVNDRLLGYWEVHMEQGPVLEQESLPVGVVSAIAGACRSRIRFTGEAGHAGTVPMNLRHDALAAAAELALSVERSAIAEGVVGTVGQFSVRPGAVNVIPATAECSLDLRSIDDGVLARVLTEIQATSMASGARRGVAVDWDVYHRAEARHCAPRFLALFEHAVATRGLPVRVLPSGAGHDAMLMANITDMAMLFVRCTGGISHHPDEFVSAHDAEIAVDILMIALEKQAQSVLSAHSSSGLESGAPAQANLGAS
ncbi:MAG: allantoate amidohydrolase [Halothiobacillus sp. 24-54-40]|jgi:allantoate deiminase|nr:MAG: allantoate amidohydrolase [Halothiobacillus sp. 20-53-49]OYZ87119.1 MAG: allantoate amidohydrolase [Halothiobacillus sp. 24-54-40]OZA80724.1 MAG: allantoate amidohydrolase [Halothiobacillus sp. 39-53-45]HQS03289.1 allantoate amidohydrolase [Halothiobacillus sp.]HQT37975.1 allantoate amidohydrolase [Acidocella sp.]